MAAGLHPPRPPTLSLRFKDDQSTMLCLQTLHVGRPAAGLSTICGGGGGSSCSRPPRCDRQAPAAFFAAPLAALASAVLWPKSGQRRHARFSITRTRAASVPTEYYSLLGLPMFTSDPKEIKAAHRRVVKLVHPDVLGGASGELQAVVTEAYSVLNDEESRAAYDEKLRSTKPTLAKSKWAEDAPADVMGVFVDESKCAKCYKCVNVASSTFGIREAAKGGTAFVSLQYGDDRTVINEALAQCPTEAISYAAREDLPKLEYAMAKSSKLRLRAKPWELEDIDGPFDIYQELMLDELIGMDMEKALESAKDPYEAAKIAEELSGHARKIAEAAETIPEDTRERIWPSTSSEAASDAEALGEGVSLPRRDRSDPVQEGDSQGVQRADMKATVFFMYDLDGDGFLFDAELREFASQFGFEGSDAEWAEEYQMMCADYRCSPVQGLDLRGFSRLLDDEEGCPLSDDDLAAMLSESGQLPRAG